VINAPSKKNMDQMFKKKEGATEMSEVKKPEPKMDENSLSPRKLSFNGRNQISGKKLTFNPKSTEGEDLSSSIKVSSQDLSKVKLSDNENSLPLVTPLKNGKRTSLQPSSKNNDEESEDDMNSSFISQYSKLTKKNPKTPPKSILSKKSRKNVSSVRFVDDLNNSDNSLKNSIQFNLNDKDEIPENTGLKLNKVNSHGDIC
jgi:hypothetical protein